MDTQTNYTFQHINSYIVCAYYGVYICNKMRQRPRLLSTTATAPTVANNTLTQRRTQAYTHSYNCRNIYFIVYMDGDIQFMSLPRCPYMMFACKRKAVQVPRRPKIYRLPQRKVIFKSLTMINLYTLLYYIIHIIATVHVYLPLPRFE